MDQAAFAPFAALDLDPIKVKLMHVASGEGWSLEHASAVEHEYRRFLFLMKLFPEDQTAPLMDVDTFWHYHILDTLKYAADCEQLFGYFLHHFPYIGLRGEDDEVAHVAAGERMRELYETTFGQAYGAGLANPTAVAKQGVTDGAGALGLQSSAFSGRATAPAQVAFSGRAAAPAQVAFSGRATAPTQVAFSGRATAPAQVAFSGRATAPAQVAFSGRATAPAQVAFSGRATGPAQVAFSGRATTPAVAKAAFSGRVADDAKVAFSGRAMLRQARSAFSGRATTVFPLPSATASAPAGVNPRPMAAPAVPSNLSEFYSVRPALGGRS